MSSITFTIPGKVVGWKRARRRGKQYFTDPEMAAYQEAIQILAKAAGVRPTEGPMRLLITAYYPMLKGMTARERLDAVQRVLRPTARKDIDNVLKNVMDALNGIAYADDNCVCDVAISKFYGEPQLSITVGPA